MHQPSMPMGSFRILHIPIIPRYVSWLFPTWSTCCLIGMWPHSTPISWVPAFDFHCGLAGPLIMQRGSVRSPALITASCPTAKPQPPGEHVHPKLRNRASSYRHFSFKHARGGGAAGTNRHPQSSTILYVNIIGWGWKNTPTNISKNSPRPRTCANSCPLHWCFHASHGCWKTPRFHQRVHVRVKWEGGSYCMCKCAVVTHSAVWFEFFQLLQERRGRNMPIHMI